MGSLCGCLHVGRAENVDEELDLDLRTVQTAVLNIARSPLSFLDGRVGTAAAAALRFREAVSLAIHPISLAVSRLENCRCRFAISLQSSCSASAYHDSCLRNRHQD